MFLFTFLLPSAVTQAQEDNSKHTNEEIHDPEMNCTKNVKFSSAELKQLDQIYFRIYKDYVDLIEFYAWSGALTEDQKKLRYEMLKNYIKTFHQRKYRWCSEHESDEWEEEWYNNDHD
jgi:hypothetical protein